MSTASSLSTPVSVSSLTIPESLYTYPPLSSPAASLSPLWQPGSDAFTCSSTTIPSFSAGSSPNSSYNGLLEDFGRRMEDIYKVISRELAAPLYGVREFLAALKKLGQLMRTRRTLWPGEAPELCLAPEMTMKFLVVLKQVIRTPLAWRDRRAVWQDTASIVHFGPGNTRLHLWWLVHVIFWRICQGVRGGPLA